MIHFRATCGLKQAAASLQKSGRKSARRGVAISALAVAVSLIHSTQASATTYTFTNLGVVPNNVTAGYGINNSEVVAGTLGSTPAVSNGGGPLVSFGTSGNPIAYAVNDSGVVVGGDDNTQTNPAFYSAPSSTRTVTLLPTAFNTDPGSTGTGSDAALAVNGNTSVFEVVGRSSIASGDSRAFYWTPGSTTLTSLTTGDNTGLGDSQTGAQSQANGINSSGQIVGQASAYAGGTYAPHAFLYSGTKVYDLGTESGSAGTSIANAISNSGVIAGSSDENGTTQAFTYDGYNLATVTASGDGDTQLNGTFHPLGSLGDGLNFSEALAINSSGVVVGDSQDDDGNQLAFIYTNGTMYDLNTLDKTMDPALPTGYTLEYASGINNAGDITGYGVDAAGDQTAFLLTPSAAVPEPTSTSILLGGLAMLTTRRRRRI